MILVLLDGVAPRVAAVRCGVDVRRVYRDTEWVKRGAIEDLVVRVLLESLETGRRDLLWT